MCDIRHERSLRTITYDSLVDEANFTYDEIVWHAWELKLKLHSFTEAMEYAITDFGKQSIYLIDKETFYRMDVVDGVLMCNNKPVEMTEQLYRGNFVLPSRMYQQIGQLKVELDFLKKI
jgi:hypothetical protein